MKRLVSSVIIISFFLVFAQFVFKSATQLRGPAIDFEILYLAGKQVLKGDNPYLVLGSDIFRYPPPILLIFAPLAALPIIPSQALWFLASLASFILGSYLLFKIADHINGKFSLIGKWQLWLIYLLLCLRFFPLRHNLGSGQVNTFLFLLLVLVFFLQLKRKEFASSLALALAIGLKVTPLIFVLVLFLQKKYKSLLWVFLGLVALVVITAIAISPNIFSQYQTVAGTYLDFGISRYQNQALTGFLNRVFINPGFVLGVYFAALTVFLLFFVHSFRSLRKSNFLKTVVLWNTSILAMLIFSPFAWQFHFTLAIFPLFMTTCLAAKTRSSYKAFLVIAFSYVLMGSNIRDPLVYQAWGILGSLILSHTLLGAILLLFLNLDFLRRTKDRVIHSAP